MRRTFVSGNYQAVGQNTRTEIAPYEADEHLVPAIPFEHRDQTIVIDGIEEFGKVHFDNPRKLFKNPCSQAELNKIVPFGFSLQPQKNGVFCHQNSIILLC